MTVRPGPPAVAIGETAERLYLQENMTANEIAAHLFVSNTTVLNALRRRNVPLRPPGRHGRTYVPIGKCTRAAAMYRAGATGNEVAERLDVSLTTAWRWIRRGGVTEARKGRIAEARTPIPHPADLKAYD